MDDDWNQPESDKHRANNMATFIHPGVNSIFSQPKVAVLNNSSFYKNFRSSVSNLYSMSLTRRCYKLVLKTHFQI